MVFNTVLTKLNVSGEKDGCKLSLEAANRCDILYLIDQESFIFIREKSGKRQGNLESDVCSHQATVSRPRLLLR